MSIGGKRSWTQDTECFNRNWPKTRNPLNIYEQVVHDCEVCVIESNDEGCVPDFVETRESVAHP